MTAMDRPLIRGIGVKSATLLVITNVIGSAIFLTPGSMAAVLPSETLLLLAWVAGGVIALCGGLTYACMLVILTGSTATVAVGFAKYLSYFIPAVSTNRIVVSLAMPWGAWSISAGRSRTTRRTAALMPSTARALRVNVAMCARTSALP